MNTLRTARHIAVALAAAFSAHLALAKLPTPTPEQAKAAEAKKQQAAEHAAREKQELAEAMDRVAARWRERAAAKGWKTHPPTAVDADGGQAKGAAGNAAASMPIRSEKAGTAPPSEDVKDPAKKGK